MRKACFYVGILSFFTLATILRHSIQNKNGSCEMLTNATIAPVKILIVDDEADICYFLSSSLSKKGYTTTYSLSLDEAKDRLKTESPAILLLDNHLPDGRGVDFVASIRPQYPHLKIIMITAHDTPQDRAKAYGNGVNFFLSKPFTLAEISKAVELVNS